MGKQQSAAVEQPAAFDLSKQEAATQQDLASARQARQDLLKSLANGADVRDELDAIELEIASHERALARFGEAQKVAQQAYTVAARQKRHKASVAAGQAALADAQKLGELSTEVLLTIATLHGQLDAVADQRDAVFAHLRSAIGDSGQPFERAEQVYEVINRTIRELTLHGQFAAALWSAGVGRRGIEVDPAYVDVKPIKFFDHAQPEATLRRVMADLGGIVEQLARLSAQGNRVQQ